MIKLKHLEYVDYTDYAKKLTCLFVDLNICHTDDLSNQLSVADTNECCNKHDLLEIYMLETINLV